ncbi:MAG: hypothetical protein P1U56_04350 [Saprospiraceae bacterium]|nr:hypothetical protein [Saprospiraceae bacterium]
MKNLIELTSPKGEKILVNMNHVSHLSRTPNKHTSVNFNYSLGMPRRSAFIVVKESIATIQAMIK